MKFVRLSLLYSLFFLLLFFVDRITKYFVMNYIPYYEINSFFSVYYVQNTGVSWGIGDGCGQGVQLALTMIAISLISLIARQAIAKYRAHKNIIPEILISAGAVSNVYDRFFYGGVLDFLCFQFGHWQFPIFNCADIMIVCGIGLIVINEIFFHE